MDDDRDQRQKLFETRQGLTAVNPNQKPVTMDQYFQNADLPQGFKRFQVYATEHGPVIEKKPPMQWSALHDQRLDDTVEQSKRRIEEFGYYVKQTLREVRTLAEPTDRSFETVLSDFHDRFKARYGIEPSQMVKDWRLARGLPVQEGDQSPAMRRQKLEL